MAQVRRERFRRLARRFGAHAGVALSLGLVALLAAALAIGLLVRGSGGGVLIERAGSGTGASETGVASGDSESGDSGGRGEKREEGATDGERVDEVTLLVHVDGAVAVPGVYELSDGDRVKDAVEAAGGLAEGADTSGMNLAARVVDGDKVFVPLEGEEAPVADVGGSGTRDPLVNINTATEEELDELPGVGESTARAIIEDRERNGPFALPEDLMRVSGIGEKKFDRLEAMICV